MNVSMLMSVTIDLVTYNLLEMTPEQIDPLIQQFGEIAGVISEEIGSLNDMPETEHNEAWAQRWHDVDYQLTEVALVFQMCTLARSRAAILRPEGEPDGTNGIESEVGDASEDSENAGTVPDSLRG